MADNGGVEAAAGFTPVDDMQVFSSTESPEQIKETLGTEEKPDLSKAASELGRKGGEASAEARKARKAETVEEPEPQEAVADEQAQTAETEDKPKTKKGNPRHDPSARVAQATREAAELRRKVAEYEAYIERVESLDRQLKRDPNAPPNKEDFEEFDDYVAALAQHAADQKFRAARQQWETEQRAAAFEARLDHAVSSYSDVVAKHEAKNPGFVEAVADFADALVPSFAIPDGQPVGPENVLADEILSSAHAPALMLYLQEHPEEYEGILDLPSPRMIAREVAKLETRLDAATPVTSSKPESSKAPPPLRQVKGAPHTADTPPGDDASYEEHERYWNAVDRKRRSAR